MLKGRQILLSRVDGHARLVSHAVLEIMGDLPDRVEGGEIVRDSEGNPTGGSGWLLHCVLPDAF